MPWPLRYLMGSWLERGFVLALLAGFLPYVFSSQVAAQVAADSADSDPNTYKLTGTVVNAITGAPVPRALVQVYGHGLSSMLTNSEGQFEFSGLPAGEVSVMARKPGFFGEEQGLRRSGFVRAEIARVGPDGAPAVVKLVPESVISGRITSNGEPVEGAPVQAIALGIEDGRKTWTAVGNVSSDEDGEFRMANLSAGEYFVVAGPKWNPLGGATKGHELGYSRTFYPGAPQAEGSGMTLGAGQRMEVEISLKREPWYRVSGKVRLNENAPNVAIELMDAWGHREGPSRYDAETGEFETRGPEGNYTLRVQGFGLNPVPMVADLPISVTGDVSGVQVMLGPGHVIPVKEQFERSGTRKDSTGAPPPQISIWLRRSGFFEGGTNMNATTDTTGRIAFGNLEAGTYWLEMTRVGPWYVESAQCGDLDLLRESMTIGAGAPCGEIDLVLRDDGATLKVNATWEGDPQTAMAVLLPEKAPEQAVFTPVLKGSGTQFNDLAPGDYNVILVDRVEGLEYKNPEAMSGYLSKAAHATLGPSQQTKVNLELLRVEK